MNTEDSISDRLVALQGNFMTKIETLRHENQGTSRQIELLLLGQIEILDLLQCAKEENLADSFKILLKAQRRMLGLLEKFGVTEIKIEGDINRLKPGLVRVLESRGGASGAGLQVCRRGYMRADQVLRPVEVITTEP